MILIGFLTTNTFLWCKWKLHFISYSFSQVPPSLVRCNKKSGVFSWSPRQLKSYSELMFHWLIQSIFCGVLCCFFKWWYVILLLCFLPRAVHAKLLSVVSNFLWPMDCSPSGSSVHGILQARILEWIAMPSSSGYSRPRARTLISYISCSGRRVLYR